MKMRNVPLLCHPPHAAPELALGGFPPDDLGVGRLRLSARLGTGRCQRRQSCLHAHAVDARFVLDGMWLQPLRAVTQLRPEALRAAFIDADAIVEDGELP